MEQLKTVKPGEKPVKEAGSEPADISSIIQQARESLPEKDRLYFYLRLENAIVGRNTGYTRESLRAIVKENFNILWFEPKLMALFKFENADALIFSEAILETFLQRLSRKISMAELQKIVDEETKGTILEGLSAADGHFGLSHVEQALLSEEKQLENAVISVHNLLRILSARDKAVLSGAFDEVKNKYLSIPAFIHAIRMMPPGALDDERRKILSPQAAAAAAAVKAAADAIRTVVKDQKEVTPFLNKAEEANKLAMDKQADAFFSIYKEIEMFVRRLKLTKKDIDINSFREDVRGRISIGDLGPRFQKLFSGPEGEFLNLPEHEQLIRLFEEFLARYFQSFLGTGLPEIAAMERKLASKLPLLKDSIDKDGIFNLEIINKNLALIEEDNISQLKKACADFLIVFYRYHLTLDDEAASEMRAAYAKFEEELPALGVKIKVLLPKEVLTEQDLGSLFGIFYKEMVEFILWETIDNYEMHREITAQFMRLMHRKKLLKDNFSDFLESMVQMMKMEIGSEKTEQIFKSAYSNLKKEYGSPLLSEITRSFPKGILDAEKFESLTREELQKTSKALQETEKMKSKFTNIAAHELKTPLTPILSNAQMLMEEKGLSPDLREMVEIIYESAKRQEKLVGDILSISKLETNEMKFEFAKTDLSNLLRSAVKEFSSAPKKAALQLILPKTLPKVNADSTRLTQVVTNLIANALKFTEKGRITIKARLAGNSILVTIADTGIGIKKGDIPNLFTKFFQVEDIAIRKKKGSGLGLAICKEIILAHKGKIWVESRGLGHGSSFTFSLPIKGKTANKILDVSVN